MSDYDRIAEAIDFITRQVGQQPTLAEVAAHVHLSPYHFQRLFSRWAGVTPKRYLQVLTLERAKGLLRAARPLDEVSDRLGLSSASRLYDHFVQLEAVTPGEFKRGGEDLHICYGLHDSPFGKAFIAATPRGICHLGFPDSDDLTPLLADVQRNWPGASLEEDRRHTRTLLDSLFRDAATPDGPLSLHVSGTNFQVNVWKALLRIPPAQVVSYAQVARAVGRPGSARAVGGAVGANPVAWLIPCHRVIQQSGDIGGYHWGTTRKHALHAWESARQAATSSGSD